MLILDRSRALDRMIWTAGRHAVVIPDPFSSAFAPAAAPTPIDDAAWSWRDEPSFHRRGPRRLSSTFELRPTA